jgi:hypothetical protein
MGMEMAMRVLRRCRLWGHTGKTSFSADRNQHHPQIDTKRDGSVRDSCSVFDSMMEKRDKPGANVTTTMESEIEPKSLRVKCLRTKITYRHVANTQRIRQRLTK